MYWFERVPVNPKNREKRMLYKIQILLRLTGLFALFNDSFSDYKSKFIPENKSMSCLLYLVFLTNHIFLQPTMILGRVAYLGVLSRRSAVTTAGVLILIVSRPPSISLTTLTLSPSNDTSDAKVPCNTKIQYDYKTKLTNN